MAALLFTVLVKYDCCSFRFCHFWTAIMGNYVNRGWSESPANDFESLLNPLCYPWRNTARFNEADVHVVERSPEDLQRIKEVKNWVRGPDYDKKWTLIYPFDGIAVPFPPVPVPFGEDDWQFKALKGLTLASFVYMVLAKRQGWHKLK